MNLGTLPGETQVEITHPGGGNTLLPRSSKQLPNTRLLTCKPLKADTRLANLQLQTAGLERTEKPDCQLVIEGLEGLGTVSLPNILHSCLKPPSEITSTKHRTFM